jgi:hypothetical protein
MWEDDPLTRIDVKRSGVGSSGGGAVMDCTNCGEELKEYEVGEPRTGQKDGEHLCDDCYHEEHEFSCSYCEGWFDRDPDRFIVVEEGAGDGVGPGLYEVIIPDYWRGDRLVSDALRKLVDINPIQCQFWGESVGHVCPGCVEKLLGEKGGE